MKKLTKGITENPFGFIKRAFFKTVIGPLKYRKDGGYSARDYWRNRFQKYGYSFQGAGDESLSVEQNEEQYQKAAVEFKEILKQENIDLHRVRILEIGIGAAFYTRLLHDSGVSNYTGVDITDVLFQQHREKFPGYTFIKKDITSEIIEGKFDLIIMIDVVQHIIKEDKVASAMEHVKNCINEHGMFIIAPLVKKSEKHHFYVHTWTADTIKKSFHGFTINGSFPFRGGEALVIKKTGAPD